MGPTDPLIAFIVFMQETTDWRLPIIDRDPAVPLSETNPIAPYDGSHNYLSWLTQASRDDLDGAAVRRTPAARLSRRRLRSCT